MECYNANKYINEDQNNIYTWGDYIYNCLDYLDKNDFNKEEIINKFKTIYYNNKYNFQYNEKKILNFINN